ncbi:efflux RND transporter permease subunit [Aureibacillus halotolerans]|uniref:HAE1 family hydrophobic/amphiphilic exporter-1 n=1 Tax=Aureibacillus halotolerans TaxID=1508390 RepID=A0A4R6TRC6_9BACI|nr:efflux RND transporter permease subunit [Aureibacillus halotolerans]TDQ36110.1 HAE1 family hydrophobic/amphiphilic exporter-1 [Aureibacillus halotolerans]
MKNLVAQSVKRPVGVIMIVMGIIALGIISLRSLPVNLYPDIELPIAVVATSYPGAAPQEVENLVSSPLEGQLSTIEGIDSVQSTSQSSSSLIILNFQSGTNLDNALISVRESVDTIKGSLPDGAQEPSVLRFDPQQIPIMNIGVLGGDLESMQLVAEDVVQPAFERTKGVGSASIDGGIIREIHLELNKAQLNRYGLTPSMVVQVLGSENASASGGVLERGGKELQIRIEGEFESLDDISNTLVPLPEGGNVTIEQIATLVDTYQDSSAITKVNGEPALVLSILKQSDANTVDVADAMYETIEDLQAELPEGVTLNMVVDSSTFIRDAIDSVINNIIIGGLLAMGVLLLFLKSVRATLVIGLSIPIAIVSTFALMYFTGATLNILTLGGLALGIGMMVDSSIVVLENIFSYKQRGNSIEKSAIEGGGELGSAVVATTTTSLVVFLPIIFVTGIAADLFAPLALTVSFSNFAAAIVALTLVPMLAAKLISNETKKKKRRWFKKRSATSEPTVEEEQDITPAGEAKPKKVFWFDRIMNWMIARYERMLKRSLKFRKTTLLVVFLMFIGSFALIPFIGGEFIPSSDQGQLSISVTTPDGSLLEETEAVTNQINEAILPYKDIVASNYLAIGGSGMFGVGSSSANTASYTIQLIPAAEREMTTDQLMAVLQEKTADIIGAEIDVSAVSAGLGTGAPIQIQVKGEEYDTLKDLSEQVTWVLEDIEGLHSIESSASASRPEMQINVDRKVAATYGLTYQDISSQVQLAFNGQTATFYREAGDEIDVKVILPEQDRTSIEDLQNTTIQTQSGSVIPLSAVAELEQVQGPISITRQDQERQINVSAAIEGNDLSGATQQITMALEQMSFPDGYSYQMGGQSTDMAESFTSLAFALVFSIFLVYAVMAIQFESFLHPFIIMFSMPTSIIGVLVGLFVTNTSLSVTAFIGFIMLAGIVVSNAIILVDYVNILRSREYERYDALIQSGKTRLRPILMTTIATILGMIPMALGIGEGSEAQAPLAIVIIFGLTFSTFFTLLLVPVMYTYLDDFAGFLRKFFKGQWRPRNPFRRRKKKTGEDPGVNA